MGAKLKTRKNNKIRCLLSNKVKFKTHTEALIRGGELLVSGNKQGEQCLRAYLCSFCECYHLTSH